MILTMSQPAPNPVLYYSSGDYSTTGERLMGKNSANEGFLKGYVTHSGQDEFICYGAPAGFKHFSERVRELAAPRTPATRMAGVNDFQILEQAGCFYIPSCQVEELAWQRRRYNQKAYSVCGLTHTTASERPMTTLRNVVFSPTQAWDALICTSTAVRDSCEYVIGSWCEYFAQRFGMTPYRPPIRLPVIPLGVDAQQYADSDAAAEARALWRKKLGITDNSVVFLFVGRLSAHGKAHPTPMYRALEQAARRTTARVHLIQAGWFANAAIEKMFKEGASALCPSVHHIFLDGRSASVRNEVWFAADVFISLSDNIQETFGLTPIEAMAAGLPVIVTDWDGYKDTVRDGVDGFRLPTLAPPPRRNGDLAYFAETGADTYDHYIANCCQITSVDVAACTRACLALIERPELRRTMGEAGRRRACDTYDWRQVIAAYQNLWSELNDIRRSSDESVPVADGQPPHPLFDDPFSTFAVYPTEVLRDEAVVRLRPDAQPDDYRRFRAMSVNKFGRLPDDETGVRLLNRAHEKDGASVGDLLAEEPEANRNMAARALLWSAKVGLISIGEHNAGSEDERPSDA
jgi:glycosyltransferase involved in cell wall biosynthesis